MTRRLCRPYACVSVEYIVHMSGGQDHVLVVVTATTAYLVPKVQHDNSFGHSIPPAINEHFVDSHHVRRSGGRL